MSSLYALRDYDPVQLRTTGHTHKIYRPRMQVCDERGRGPCKSQPEFVQNGFKILSHNNVEKIFFYLLYVYYRK